jgi:Condensation domain
MQIGTETPIDDLKSLTPVEHYFVQAAKSEGNALLHVKSALKLTGNLDIQALENAINTLIEQNQALRTAFYEAPSSRSNRPRFVRLLMPSLVRKLEVQDLAERPAGEKNEAIEQARKREEFREFDLANGPLFHFELLRTEQDEYYLFITVHHTIVDAWSLNILIRELAQYYNGYCAGPKPIIRKKPADVSDYLQWYHRQTSPGALQRATHFWSEYLQGFTGNQMHRDFAGDVRVSGYISGFQPHWVEFSCALPEKLSDFARRNGLLPFVAPLLAYGIMLSGHAKSDSLYILNLISGRFSPAFNDVIGLLISFLLTKVKAVREKTALEMMKQLQVEFLSALPYGAIPIMALVSGLARVNRYHHRFWADINQTKILFNFLNFDNTPAFASLFNNLECEYLPAHDSDPALNEINLFLQCGEGTGVNGWLGCWKAYYKMETVQRMSAAYQRILVDIVARPDCRVAELLPE